MENTIMTERLESIHRRHDQWRGEMRHLFAVLDDLERQQRSAGTSMASEKPRNPALLQEEDNDKELLRKLHERSSPSPPSVPEEMTMKRQSDIASSLTALQQGSAITEIATHDTLLAELRSLVQAAEAEALQQMRVQAQNDRDRMENERHRAQELAIKNEELTVKNEELTVKNEELTAKNEELAVKNEELTIKNKELTIKNEELTIKNEELRDRKSSK
ncbi:hypothetical protein KC316_g2522 [Hortaea werneckii]|nr:hypothetical protein KC324_g2187 [Hortaea werneckii]KAI7592047.1 hypothetical protein KC316_g2522 [Hortaea werneckii]